ncbi:DUF1189 family protein [Planomicrobium sp. YIM 101495]|uniref:DUF1189 family protein n=1 Tax=Planomicrobium sp. YIM 101495 TaxID=2665160 RepID=UPI0013FB0DE1|nr:DUF1189 domain-containing protein [Planomicrobium sp. YIM 101495]
MNFFQLLKASLMEPKKQAAARILPIGRVLRFVFIVIAILTVLSFVELVGSLQQTADDMSGLLDYINEIEWILYPFSLLSLFVSTTLYQFILISVYAFAGMAFLKMRKKRGEYRHMWRTTSLAVTVPSFLAFFYSFTGGPGAIGILISLLTVLYLYVAAGYYPNLPGVKKPHQS